MGQVCGCGRYPDQEPVQWSPRSRRDSINLKPNQVYHLSHVECHPYQGRRSRYSTQSASILGLLTRRGSSNRSTHQSSVDGSHGALRQDSLASSSSVPHRDTSEIISNPIPLCRYQDPGAFASDPLARQPSLSELQHGMSYDEFRRSGVNRVFRSYLDYQAVRQSYLLAMYDEGQVDSEPSEDQHTQASSHGLSMEVFLCFSLYLVSFLFVRHT